MQIPIETMIGWGATGLVIAGHYFVNEYRVGRMEKEFTDLWRWKDSHERDASETRDKFQAQLSELRGSQLVVTEQFRQIMEILTEIKQRLTILENHKNGRSQ